MIKNLTLIILFSMMTGCNSIECRLTDIEPEDNPEIIYEVEEAAWTQ